MIPGSIFGNFSKVNFMRPGDDDGERSIASASSHGRRVSGGGVYSTDSSSNASSIASDDFSNASSIASESERRVSFDGSQQSSRRNGSLASAVGDRKGSEVSFGGELQKERRLSLDSSIDLRNEIFDPKTPVPDALDAKEGSNSRVLKSVGFVSNFLRLVFYASTTGFTSANPNHLGSRQRLIKRMGEAKEEGEQNAFTHLQDEKKFKEIFQEIGANSGLDKNAQNKMAEDALKLVKYLEENEEKRKKKLAEGIDNINQSSLSEEQKYIDEASMAWKFRVAQFALMCTGIGGVAFLAPLLDGIGAVIDSGDIGHEIFNQFSKIPVVGHIAGAVGWGVDELPGISEINNAAQAFYQGTPLSLAGDVLNPIAGNSQLQGAVAGAFLVNGWFNDYERRMDINEKRDRNNEGLLDLRLEDLRTRNELMNEFYEEAPKKMWEAVEATEKAKQIAERMLDLSKDNLENLEFLHKKLDSDGKVERNIFSMAKELKDRMEQGSIDRIPPMTRDKAIPQLVNQLLCRDLEENLQIAHAVNAFNAIEKSPDVLQSVNSITIPVQVTSDDKTVKETVIKDIASHSNEAKKKIFQAFLNFCDNPNADCKSIAKDLNPGRDFSKADEDYKDLKEKLFDPVKQKFEGLVKKDADIVHDRLYGIACGQVGGDKMQGKITETQPSKKAEQAKEIWLNYMKDMLIKHPDTHPKYPSASRVSEVVSVREI